MSSQEISLAEQIAWQHVQEAREAYEQARIEFIRISDREERRQGTRARLRLITTTTDRTPIGAPAL
jgi:hypothetical protein